MGAGVRSGLIISGAVWSIRAMSGGVISGRKMSGAAGWG